MGRESVIYTQARIIHSLHKHTHFLASIKSWVVTYACPNKLRQRQRPKSQSWSGWRARPSLQHGIAPARLTERRFSLSPKLSVHQRPPFDFPLSEATTVQRKHSDSGDNWLTDPSLFSHSDRKQPIARLPGGSNVLSNTKLRALPLHSLPDPIFLPTCVYLHNQIGLEGIMTVESYESFIVIPFTCLPFLSCIIHKPPSPDQLPHYLPPTAFNCHTDLYLCTT